MLKAKIIKTLFAIAVLLMMFSPVMETTGLVQTVKAEDEIKIQLNNSGQVSNSNPKKKREAVNNFFKKFKFFVVAVTGFAALFMVVIFIWLLLKLGASSGNPMERHQIIKGILLSGLATAGLGSITLLVALFFNLFR